MNEIGNSYQRIIDLYAKYEENGEELPEELQEFMHELEREIDILEEHLETIQCMYRGLLDLFELLFKSVTVQSEEVEEALELIAYAKGHLTVH